MKVNWKNADNRIQHFDKKKQRRIYCDYCDTPQNWKRWGEMKLCNKCGRRID